MEPTYSRTSISATAAQVITTACIRKTAELDGSVAVVVVDEEGSMKSLVRMDEVPAYCATAAHDRARTALSRDDSRDDHPRFAARDRNGAANELGTRQAGRRLVAAGQLVGALGVSGAGAADDATIAAAGVAALTDFCRELGELAAEAG